MWIDNDWPEAAETLQTVRKQTSKLKSKHLRKCRETSVQHKVIKEHLDWFAFEKSNLSDNSSLFQTRPPPNFRQSHQLLGFSDLIMNKILAFLDVSDILSLSYTCKQGHYVTFPIWSTIPVAVNIPNVYDKLTHTSKANESRSVETRQVFVINEGHHGADHPQHNALVTGNSHHTSSLNRPTMADDIDVAMMFRTLRAPTCTHTVALNPPRLACSGVSSDGEDGFSTAHTHTRGGRSITTTYTPTVPILPFTQAYTRYYPCPRLTVTQRGRPSHVGGCNGGGVCVDHTTCAAVMAAVTQAALHAPALHVHAGVSVCVCEDINGSVAVSDPVPHPHYPPIEALTLMSDIPRHINAVLRERLCFESNIACLKEISVDDHHVDVLLLVCRLIVEHNSQLTHSESVIGALDVMSLSRCSSGELEQLASVLDEVQLRLQQHVLQRQQALLQRREQEDLLRSLQLCDDDGVATYVRDESTFLTSSADTHTAFIDMRELTCSECDIPDALIHALSHCRELRRLRVVHCQLSPSSLPLLFALPLQVLDVSGSRSVSLSTFREIPPSTSLTVLSLAHWHITHTVTHAAPVESCPVCALTVCVASAVAAHIVSALPRLSRLDVSRTNFVAPCFLHVLSQLPSLQHLRLSCSFVMPRANIDAFKSRHARIQIEIT